VRTTLTLDDDVARLLEQIRRRRGATLKQVVNDALREGLPRLEAPRRARSRHETKSVSLGGCLIGDVNDVAEALAVAEGDGFR
jgi:hypothetical protein